MKFDWDDANILHLARHDITPDEAEDVVTSNPVDLESQIVDGEERFPQVGPTRVGRLLTIVSTARGSRIRIITGWNSTRSEQRIYLLDVLEKGS